MIMESEKREKKILELAEKYIKKGKFREAIAEYNKLISGDEGKDLNIRNLIAELYLKAGEKEKAVSEFKKIARYYEEKGLLTQCMAIYKKIDRINPDDFDSGVKLADLYLSQGFISEAKKKYLIIADKLRSSNQNKEAISLYEKVLKIDKNDQEARLSLAILSSKEGLVEKAVEELNEIAEFRIKKGEYDEAEEVLKQAKNLRDDILRTSLNLIYLYRRQNRKEEAFELIQRVLQLDENNKEALSHLGSIYLEEENLQKAEEIFLRMLRLQPKDIETRVKLGRIYIHQDKLDQAFELYQPIVETLIRKEKLGKAIGLLGLILNRGEPHFPTLEKLADIFKLRNQKKQLEIVLRVLLQESKKMKLIEKEHEILKELVALCPQDEELYCEYREVKKRLGILDEERISGEPSILVDESKEIIKRNLAKAELYMEQGLLRNARRILEHLRLMYPGVSSIEEKIEALTKRAAEIREEEIPERVEKAMEKENEFIGFLLEREMGEGKITAAEIFAETDIIPIVQDAEEKKRKYYNLERQIDEELEAIQAVCLQQLKGDTTTMEKELSEIVSEFKRSVEEKIDKKDFQSRYNLAVAYFDQGLYDEAVEEFKLASEDKRIALDCYTSLSLCFKEKRDYEEALRWLEKAQEIVDKDSNEYFRLKYEMASLYEEMGKREEALNLYLEIKNWDSNYRKVAQKIKKLKES